MNKPSIGSKVGLLMLTGIVAVGLGLFLTFLGPKSVPTFKWDIPDGFPAPNVPADNPMSSAKIALGRALFFDSTRSRRHNRTV